MAEIFGCDLAAVTRTAGQLGTVATELRSFGKRRDEFAGSLRSNMIHVAIQSFEEDSSDHRDKVVQTIDALKKVLEGLIEGCTAVDRALGEGLDQIDNATSGLPGSPAGHTGPPR